LASYCSGWLPLFGVIIVIVHHDPPLALSPTFLFSIGAIHHLSSLSRSRHFDGSHNKKQGR
jgi:hypothetical protein